VTDIDIQIVSGLFTLFILHFLRIAVNIILIKDLIKD